VKRGWFNGAFVGRTDDNGTVTARVPYERHLNVTVESPGGDPCESFRYTSEQADTNEQTDAIRDTTYRESGTKTFSRLSAGVPLQQTTPNRTEENATGRYEVFGNANLYVQGVPYPNSTVQLIADVSGVPMRQANVIVDGEHVGNTSENGNYELTVPDTDRISVKVTRGDYTAGTVIDVLNLNAAVVPTELLIVPGEPIAVGATRSDERVKNATVELGDKRLGTTGTDGRYEFPAPSNVAETVTVTTTRQRATAPIWTAYAQTVGGATAILVFGVLSTAIMAHRSGRRSGVHMAAVWAGVSVVFGATAVWEYDGLIVSLGVVTVPVLVHYRAVIRGGGVSAAHSLIAATNALVHWVGTQLYRLRSVPRSLTALAGQLASWLHSVPQRVLARLRMVSSLRLGALVAATVFIGTAAYRWGPIGFISSAGIVAVIIIIYRYLRADSETQPTTEHADSSEDHSTGDRSPNGSVRQLWRRLARWVCPDRWQTQTPAEISQAAIDRGLPREPVERLTEAFRDVEYGGYPPDEHREQAEKAVEAIDAAREGEK
jgi:hypothetical protein